ncbi:hypothetical protein Pcinc_043109 [Petrolisthes cinctipes]|uniref:Uncharacterized protein n=1 Tax=Petrolisthes cinctipes TaxID=88211 RepID=A0AAE1EI72_PETCI|nr:hypothetical protein Pcinc_043109 [Petrolisthes cinctipes]
MATLITRFIFVLVLITVCGATQHNNTPNNTQLSPQHLVLNYNDDGDNGVLEGHNSSSSSVTHIRNTRQLQGNIPSPTSLQAIVQGSDTVLLRWKYEGPHLDTHILVKIYVNNDIFIKDQVVLPSENSVTITDLTPNTQYSITITTVKALPRGRQVTSVTTDPVTVTTQDLDLPPPTNLQITSRDLTSVSLQWQYNGPRLDLNFLVKIYESSDNFFIKDQVVRDTSVTVSDLTPNTHYTFIVTAVKALPRGRHLSSTPVTITTQQGGPPQPQPQPTQPPTTTTTTTTTPQPSLPGNQGSGVCSLITSPGVTYNILSCSIPTSHSPLSFARTNECVTGGGVAAVNTVIVADCWGIATLILRCESDGYWHQGSNNDQLSPPTQYLCQYQTINSPVCGKRPHYEKATQGLVLFGARPNWPWLVGLFIRETYSCVATLITPTYLLTAAHCIARSQDTTSTVDPRDIRVQHVGSDGTIQRQYVSSVWVVPDFTTRPHAMSDVGLVRLERTLTFSRSLYPACLSTTTTTTTTDQHTAATFSRTSNQYKWDLVIQKPDRRCSNLERDVCTEALTLQQHQFCAIDIDEAVFLKEGSSGGPYLVNAGNDANERGAEAAAGGLSRDWSAGRVIKTGTREELVAARQVLRQPGLELRVMEERERERVQCRKCRTILLHSNNNNNNNNTIHVIDAHGQQYQRNNNTDVSGGEEALFSQQDVCASIREHNCLYISEEYFPDFILHAVNESSWTKGKLHCPGCSCRVGSFNFVCGSRCVCGVCVLPQVHILNSKIDWMRLGEGLPRPVSYPNQCVSLKTHSMLLPVIDDDDGGGGNTATTGNIATASITTNTNATANTTTTTNIPVIGAEEGRNANTANNTVNPPSLLLGEKA